MIRANVWDIGLLRRFFYAPNGVGRAAESFAALVRRHPATYTVIAWDCGGPTFRHTLYPEYKSGRDRPPAERQALELQLGKARELLAPFATILESPGFEADDIIATVVRCARSADIPVTVFTHDKDMAQLFGPGADLHDGRMPVLAEHIEKKFGVPPDRIADWLAIVGDSTDGIPGVPKLGPVAATAIMRECETLEAAIQRALNMPEPVPNPWRQLREHASEARLCKSLTVLCDEAPVAMPWSAPV